MTLCYHIMEIEQVASNDPHIRYIQIHVHIHIHIHVRVHVRIHIHIFVYTCTYIYIYIFTHKLGVGDNGGDKTRGTKWAVANDPHIIYIEKHIHIHIHIHIYTYTYTQ